MAAFLSYEVIIQGATAISSKIDTGDKSPFLLVAGLLLRLGQPDTLNIPFMAAAGGAEFNFLPILSFGSQAINPANNLGYLGAIVGGLLTGWLFNSFSKIRMKSFDFMGGARGIAVLLILLLSVILSLLFGVIWPFVQDGFNSLGIWLGATGAIGAGLYGVFNRLLIPFGLFTEIIMV